MSKLWISEECPNCGDGETTWVSDNCDGTFHDGQEWTCDGCRVQGYVCFYEDGSRDLVEYEPEENER